MEQAIDNERLLREEILNKKRDKITKLLNERRYDEIGALPGFSIVQRAEDLVNDNCSSYAGIPGENRNDAMSYVNQNFVKTNEPQPGDIVIYTQNGKMINVETYVGEGLVISKWGSAHAYKHNLKEVPRSYYQESSDIETYHRMNVDADATLAA